MQQWHDTDVCLLIAQWKETVNNALDSPEDIIKLDGSKVQGLRTAMLLLYTIFCININ